MKKFAKAPVEGVRYKVYGGTPARVEKWVGHKMEQVHQTSESYCDCKATEYKPEGMCVHRGMVSGQVGSPGKAIMEARRALVQVLGKLRLDKTLRRVRLPADPYVLEGGKVVMGRILAEGSTSYKLFETIRGLLVCVEIS